MKTVVNNVFKTCHGVTTIKGNSSTTEAFFGTKYGPLMAKFEKKVKVKVKGFIFGHCLN